MSLFTKTLLFQSAFVWWVNARRSQTDHFQEKKIQKNVHKPNEKMFTCAG